jgi:hypothetical protein
LSARRATALSILAAVGLGSGAFASPQAHSAETTSRTAVRSSFTAVQCTISAVPPASTTCTAYVAGYDASRVLSPTGTVSFTALTPTVGSSCTLAATPGISSCSVPYVPVPTLRTESPPPVIAHYGGDSHFAPSAGVASFTPVSVVLFEGLRVSEVSAAGSIEGIPVALTNTNPFAVSVDEEMTVVASAARTQTIGHAKIELAPLRTLKTKVRLSRGGRRLLKKRGRLKAVLVTRTKRAGKPAKVTRHKLLIKL